MTYETHGTNAAAVAADPRLIPGEGNPEGSAPAAWQCCGKADAVIFLGDIEGLLPDRRTIGCTSPGYERRAKCYMRPPLSDPEAKIWAEAHGGQEGYAMPDISFLLQVNPEIMQEAERMQRPVERLFRANRAGINANQPEHASRWRVSKVEDGIWAVIYE